MRISDWSSDVCSSDLKMQFTYNIANTQRAIGTKLSSKLVRKYGMSGLQPGHITVRMRGSAGPSLGAFAEIGTASCRERVCQYVSISVVAVSLKKKKELAKQQR